MWVNAKNGGNSKLKLDDIGFKVLGERNASELIIEAPVREGTIGVEAQNTHGTARSSAKVLNVVISEKSKYVGKQINCRTMAMKDDENDGDEEPFAETITQMVQKRVEKREFYEDVIKK